MSNLFFDKGKPCDGRKVLLATTSYDNPAASYTYSISRSREALHLSGISTAYLLLQGNCHVDDSRNSVMREFLDSDCTEIVFLDADVSWEPKHLLQLCEYDCDVVGGVYPYRRDGAEHMPVRNKPGCFTPDENGLIEVDGLPTGFLRIKRHVIEKMAAASKSFEKDGKRIPILFERDIYKDGRRGGDIHFCMRWAEMGGKLYAAADLRLGHYGGHVIYGSLSAALRKQLQTTLIHVTKCIRENKEYDGIYKEAIDYVNNPWGAQIDVIAPAVGLARNAKLPIIETGSGLTTILMAAATDQEVWCIEHNEHFGNQLRAMAYECGLKNIVMVKVPIKDGWYDLSEDMAALPEKFAFGLNDGPPRMVGDRMRFYEVFGDRCEVILTDDANGYKDKINTWAESRKRPVEYGDQRAAVILRAA